MTDPRIAELEQLAREQGLDFFPVVFETVTPSTMYNVCAYGLPTRARHWSYGRSYDHQKMHGQMGLSKVYEMIVNNNPSYAFMLDTNTPTQNLFIAAHCFGHCLVPGTLVETDRGPRPISEIQPGDAVLTHNGVFGQVLARSKKRVNGSLYTIRVAGNEPITSTGNHPFLVVRHSKCILTGRQNVRCRPNCKSTHKCQNKKVPLGFEPEWVPASKLKKGDFAVFPRPKWISSQPSRSVEISGQKGKGQSGGVRKISYSLPMSGELGEFLGLYAAEGYAKTGGQMGLCFHSDETPLHVRSRQLVRSLFGLSTYHDLDEKSHSCQILFNEKVLAGWLRSNVGQRCEQKHIPEDVLKKASPEFISGFIRGVFHGDGDHCGPRVFRLTTTSLRLASQVRSICLHQGVVAVVSPRNRRNRKPAYIVTVTGESMDRLAVVLGWKTTGRNRIFEKSWCDDDNVYIPIKEISSVEDECHVINLQVPGDSSFVLFGGIATHNSDFFKNNVLFKDSDRTMARHAAEHANRIDQYIEDHGLDKVERFMDIAFALDNHIDPRKGQYRKRYGRRRIRAEKKVSREFDDLLRPVKNKRPSIERTVENATLPPHPERDLLWFFINYAPLEDWERDILDIVREEAFYFHPQGMTKIMNEGWASYWHAELMYLYDGVLPEEQLEFARTHEKVVQPGGNPFRINPYYLGYRVFKDIEERWNKKHEKGESDITGRQKIFEVRAEEDDISFLRNYLTDKLVRDLKLFTFGELDDDDDRAQMDEATLYEIKDRVRNEVIEALIRPMYNNYAPRIVITDASSEKLVMRHDNREMGTLDFKYASKTLEYIWELWTAPIELHTTDDDGNEVILHFDELGFSKLSKDEELELLMDDDQE